MITNLEIALEEMQQQAEMRGLIKGRAEGEARGKVEKAQDAICKYLKRRFGDVSAGLQGKAREITSLEILDGVMEELFAANILEEARAIIRDGMERFVYVSNSNETASHSVLHQADSCLCWLLTYDLSPDIII